MLGRALPLRRGAIARRSPGNEEASLRRRTSRGVQSFSFEDVPTTRRSGQSFQRTVEKADASAS
jgi:hypothetical protein